VTLKSRIILMSFLTSFFACAVLGVAAFSAISAEKERFELSALSSKSVLWGKILAGQYDKMANASSALVRDRAFKKALQKQDIEALNENVITSYRLLSASNVLTSIQVTSPDSTVLFSTPQAFKGRTSKSLPAMAVEEGLVKRRT